MQVLGLLSSDINDKRQKNGKTAVAQVVKSVKWEWDSESATTSGYKLKFRLAHQCPRVIFTWWLVSSLWSRWSHLSFSWTACTISWYFWNNQNAGLHKRKSAKRCSQNSKGSFESGIDPFCLCRTYCNTNSLQGTLPVLFFEKQGWKEREKLDLQWVLKSVETDWQRSQWSYPESHHDYLAYWPLTGCLAEGLDCMVLLKYHLHSSDLLK